MVKKFYYENKYSWQNPPIPSKFNLPSWYKNMAPDHSNVKVLPHALTVKSCIPFLDGLTSGYMIELASDIAVQIVNGVPDITWANGDLQLVASRDGGGAPLLPTPSGHSSHHFVWLTSTSIELPSGYSLLLTHPFNRFDLPFTTLTGISDADNIMGPGNIPFFIKKDFEGIISMGTPIAQIIPFKRDDWKLEEKKGLWQKGVDKNTKAVNTVRGYYKKHSWKRKTYE